MSTRQLEFNIEFFFLCAPGAEPAVAVGEHGCTAVSSLSGTPNEAAPETPSPRKVECQRNGLCGGDADRLAGERVRDGGGGGEQ